MRSRISRPVAARFSSASVTIRPAYADDDAALARLSALDGAEPLHAPVLLAEVDGEARAALSLHDGAVVADPFFPTLHLLALLRSHAAATARPPAPRVRYRLKLA